MKVSMVRCSRLVIFFFKEKFFVSPRVGKYVVYKMLMMCSDPCQKKLYLQFYLTQIVHSNGKILFL